MATVNLQAIQLVGGCADIRTYPEAASQTFKKGALVQFSSGKVAVADADETTIVGVALHDASGTTDSDVQVALANEHNIFVANVYHATPASSVTAAGDRHKKYGVEAVGDNWHVSLADTSNNRVRIIDLDRRDAVGDTNGRVHIVFLGANATGGTGAG